MSVPISRLEHPNVKLRISCPFPIVNSVMSLQQEGEIYVWENGPEFIIHKAGFSYIFTANGDCSPLPGLFIHSGRLPVYFHIYDPPAGLIEECGSHPDHLNIKVRDRVQLRFLDADVEISPAQLPEKYTIRQIDEGNFSSLGVFNLGIGEKFWKSGADFLKNGYGYVLFEHAKPVSICYSAAVADRVAEIDIMTLEEYRGGGFARVVLTAFIRHSLDAGIIPNWDCFTDNTGSLRTALSFGFKETKRYLFLSIYNKSRKK